MKPEFIAMLAMVECGREDKKSLVPLIAWFEQVCRNARKEGLLSLEEELEAAPSDFARDLTRLLVDGYDQEAIDQYALIRMYSRKWQGVELLSALITAAGIHVLNDGDHPRELLRRLLAFLGSDRDLYREMLQQAEDDVKETALSTERVVIDGEPSSVLAAVLKRKPLTAEQRIECGRLLTVNEALRELEAKDLALLILAADPKDRTEIASNLSFQTLYKVLEEVDAYKNLDPQAVISSCRSALEQLVAMLETHSWPIGGWTGMESILKALPTEGGLKFVTYLEKLSEAPSSAFSEPVNSDFCSRLRDECLELYFDLEEALVNMSDRDLQKLLRELDHFELAMYLRYFSTAIKTKFFRNLSPRAAAQMQEDIECMDSITFEQALEARKKIIDIVSRLAQAEEITLDWDPTRALQCKAELEAHPYAPPNKRKDF